MPLGSIMGTHAALLLEHHLKRLRPAHRAVRVRPVTQQCATEDIDYPRYLLPITEREMLGREGRSTERRARQDCSWDQEPG